MEKINNRKVKERMASFETVCHEAGIKLTHQRIEIFREVAQTGDHPDAEAVFARVRKRLPTVSLDTVYRTLWLLSDLELITVMGARRERTRFDANLERHHHFVCEQCGFTRDFTSSELDRINLPDTLKELGILKNTHVEVRGICHSCAEGKNKKT